MLHKNNEKGQAIIMIVFAIIGLVGLTGLTVDGGRSYMDRRSAQGAADSGAWAAGLANAREEWEDTDGNGFVDAYEVNVTPLEEAARAIAMENGYTSENSVVEVTVEPMPVAPTPLDNGDPNPCPVGASPNVEITVNITSTVDAFFAPIIGVQTVTNRVQAVTRVCGKYDDAVFGGNAVVSLGFGMGSDCAFDSGQSSASRWYITGGGISSNSCAHSKIAASVTLDADQCVSAVDGATGGLVGKECPTPARLYGIDYINSIMPPNPCTGSITDGVYEGGGIVPTGGQTTFNNGVYCISDFDALDKKDTVLNNATLYVTDQEFKLKFAGGGSFSGTPSYTGPFSSLYIVVQPPEDVEDYCTRFTDNNSQVFVYRGNSTGNLYGTVLAPSACLDVRGNGTGTINGQLIGNAISSNGTADVFINYEVDENRRNPQNPTIDLVK
jgi:Flp pilus assembly protein TadG